MNLTGRTCWSTRSTKGLSQSPAEGAVYSARYIHLPSESIWCLCTSPFLRASAGRAGSQAAHALSQGRCKARAAVNAAGELQCVSRARALHSPWPGGWGGLLAGPQANAATCSRRQHADAHTACAHSAHSMIQLPINIARSPASSCRSLLACCQPVTPALPAQPLWPTHRATWMRLSVCHLPDTSPASMSSASHGSAGNVMLKVTCSVSRRLMSTFICSVRPAGQAAISSEKVVRCCEGNLKVKCCNMPCQGCNLLKRLQNVVGKHIWDQCHISCATTWGASARLATSSV